MAVIRDETEPSLVTQLMAERVDRPTAERLAQQAPEVCRRQLGYLDFQEGVEDRAQTLVDSIEGDWPQPTRLYWETVAQKYREPEVEAVSSGQRDGATRPSPPPEGATVETGNIGTLVQALRDIAAMPHEGDSADAGHCPVCVARHALAVWEAGQTG